MITEVRNLPNKMYPKGEIVGIVNQFGSIRIEDEHGYEIVTFQEHQNPEVMARDVAKAIELARNAGFRQGRQYVKSIILMADEV